MIWLKLTLTEDANPVWVNPEALAMMTRSDGRTELVVNENHLIMVKETPDQILNMIEELR